MGSPSCLSKVEANNFERRCCCAQVRKIINLLTLGDFFPTRKFADFLHREEGEFYQNSRRIFQFRSVFHFSKLVIRDVGKLTLPWKISPQTICFGKIPPPLYISYRPGKNTKISRPIFTFWKKLIFQPNSPNILTLNVSATFLSSNFENFLQNKPNTNI